MAPTARLPGFHFRGVVEQRVIANYPVEPAKLEGRMPPGATLWTDQGTAWLSACFVQLRHVRPAGAPKRLGLPMRYLVHRTMAHVPFPDGKRRKAVLVLEAYASPALQRWAGAKVGAPFRPARIEWGRQGRSFHVQAWGPDGRPLYEARSKASPGSKRFPRLADADAAILGMAWGSFHDGDGWRLFPETHDPWQAYGLDVETAAYALRDALGSRGEADHAIAMEDCPHQFGLAIRVRGPG